MTTVDHRYIRITELQAIEGKPSKTKIFAVVAKEIEDTIGYVRFYPRWRKYVFAPRNMTLYEENCMRAIASFVEGETRAWRKTVKERRAKA